MKLVALYLSLSLFVLQGCSSSGGSTDPGPDNSGNLTSSTSIDVPDFLPSASAAFQFDYAMTSVAGDSTTARALLFEPSSNAPADGHRLVVWAHGTTGIANSCSPSANFSQLANRDAIESLLSSGYAVLAPDYEGFGSESIHPYYVRSSHARSVVAAVPAAHQLQGANISDNWAVVGHSQGGHVALSAARGEQFPAFVLQAAVALAPGTDLAPLVERAYEVIDEAVAQGDIQSAADRTFYLNLYGAFVAHAHRLVDPEFDPQSLFGADVSPLIDMALDEATCGDYANELVATMNAHFQNGGSLDNFAGLTRDWYTSPSIESRLQAEAMADEAQSMPLLIVQGTADRQIPVAATSAFVDRQRDAGTDVTYLVLEGARHGDVAHSEFGQALTWLIEQFPPQ